MLDLVFEFLETDIWKNVTKHIGFDLDPGAYELSEQSRLMAANDGMYQTTRPLTTYGPEDAFDETLTASAFEVCMGAMSQVMFTLPVGDSSTGAPTTLASMEAWDPVQAAPEDHFTALEVWVRKLVADARKLSPLFWSHRIKHVASDSLVCIALFDEFAPENRVDDLYSNRTLYLETMAALSTSVTPGRSRGVYESILETLTFRPPDGLGEDDKPVRETNRTTWALGQVTQTCFCGWDSAIDKVGRVWCKIPQSICARSSVFSSAIQQICQESYGMYWNNWYSTDWNLSLIHI